MCWKAGVIILLYTILALIVFSVVLIAMDYYDKYCWLFIMMVCGMVITFFAVVMYIVRFGNYYQSNLFFSLDYRIFAYISQTINMSLVMNARLMNLGILLYMLAVPLFVHEFTRSFKYKIPRFILLLVPLVYNLLFYDPSTAYYIYLTHILNPHSVFVTTFFTVVHQFNQLWILIYLFYPVYLLHKYQLKNTIRYIKRQIHQLTACLCIMNLLFYGTFFLGPFKMSIHTVFVNGYWVFANLNSFSYSYYVIIPLITASALLFTLLLLLNYKMGSFIHIFVDRERERNISKMNEVMSETLHSQKNLLFSIIIVARQALEGINDPEADRVALRKIEELSNSSLKRTSEMLDSLRQIRYIFKNNDIGEVIDEAISKVSLPPNTVINWNKEQYDSRLLVSRFDYYHMVRVFINIFNNAIESIQAARREHGVIKVDIGLQFQWLIIVIQDNGTGIKKDALKKVFSPYYSGKSGPLNWGLGLSYAHKVVKAHLGQLRLESQYGEATSVQIMLPKITK